MANRYDCLHRPCVFRHEDGFLFRTPLFPGHRELCRKSNNELDEQLNGTTALAVASDPVAPARVIADYAKKLNGKFEIKGGFMDGKVVDMATINALAAIPALPVLQAQVLGTMLAPITSLACVLKQIAEKDGAPAEAAEAAAE